MGGVRRESSSVASWFEERLRMGSRASRRFSFDGRGPFAPGSVAPIHLPVSAIGLLCLHSMLRFMMVISTLEGGAPPETHPERSCGRHVVVSAMLAVGVAGFSDSFPPRASSFIPLGFGLCDGTLNHHNRALRMATYDGYL